MRLRSQSWFDGDNDVAVENRAALHAAGLPDSRGDGQPRPVVAILISSSDLNPCNLPLQGKVDAVRRGVYEAGGVPVELPVMSLGEDLMKPTAMLYRNLLAMEVEEYIRSNPVDAVVLMGNCDKTVPGLLMGAASAGLPGVLVTGGYRRPGRVAGRPLAAGVDLWRYWEQRRAGKVDDGTWAQVEQALGCSQGACNVMGTAMTMAIIAEAMGLMIPGTATLAFDDPQLTDAATEAGRRAVALATNGPTISEILTPAAFANALTVLAAVGGSTNAIVHLCALAGRRNIPLPLEAFDAAAHRVPVLVDVLPGGRAGIAAFDAAGGVPVLLRELAEIIDFDVPTVTGTLRAAPPDPDIGNSGSTAIRTWAEPVAPVGSLAVVRGNITPHGAVLKVSAATPALLHHRGPAVVFASYQDMLDQIDDPELEVSADSVLVLTGAGPRGGDGFPEWGMLPIPAKLAAQGVTDMVRISDARMSGTSYGTCVLHISPEAAVGGPLAAVRTGDTICLDVPNRRLDVELPQTDIDARLAHWRAPVSRHVRGWPLLYQQHVLQAPQGADFDFLRADTDEALHFVPPVVGRS